jgi:glyoxylase-like metal-dependent hydrolase (beta-lactamase superfamily II)
VNKETFRRHSHVCILRAPPIAGRPARNALNATPGKKGGVLTRNSGKETMKRTLIKLAAGASLFASLAVPAQAASEVSLARFDCGTPQAPVAVNQRFSDTYAYGDLKIQFVYSCYLIKHGDDYLLWDTGHAMTAPNVAPKVSLVDYLAKIDVKPEQIKYVGISHYHGDHTGQIASFPKATLLIGAREWDAISAPKPAEGVNFKPFESWIKGESKVEPLALDKDVFEDGSVIVLRTPGHTPGHSIFQITQGEEKLLVIGDAVHIYPAQFPHPEWTMAYDVNPKLAIETRRKLFKQAAADRSLVMAYHMPFPGIGHIRAAGQGYEWVPRPWVKRNTAPPGA